MAGQCGFDPPGAMASSPLSHQTPRAMLPAASAAVSMSSSTTTCSPVPPGRESMPPAGAIYLLIDIGATGLDSYDFARRLLAEQNVSTAPGSTFGQHSAGQIRISLASSEDNIREGLRRICAFINGFRGS